MFCRFGRMPDSRRFERRTVDGYLKFDENANVRQR